MKYLSKITVLVFLNLVSIHILRAQVNSSETNYIVEDMPLFENADPTFSFSRYIQEQVDNSSSQLHDSISGRILLQFWIDTTGTVVDPKIIRSINESADSLACQIVLNSPKWTPGKQRGKIVRVGFTFPMYINMEDPVYIGSKRKKNRKKH
jgi:protein TonB